MERGSEGPGGGGGVLLVVVDDRSVGFIHELGAARLAKDDLVNPGRRKPML